MKKTINKTKPYYNGLENFFYGIYKIIKYAFFSRRGALKTTLAIVFAEIEIAGQTTIPGLISKAMDSNDNTQDKCTCDENNECNFDNPKNIENISGFLKSDAAISIYILSSMFIMKTISTLIKDFFVKLSATSASTVFQSELTEKFNNLSIYDRERLERSLSKGSSIVLNSEDLLPRLFESIFSTVPTIVEMAFYEIIIVTHFDLWFNILAWIFLLPAPWLLTLLYQASSFGHFNRYAENLASSKNNYSALSVEILDAHPDIVVNNLREKSENAIKSSLTIIEKTSAKDTLCSQIFIVPQGLLTSVIILVSLLIVSYHVQNQDSIGHRGDKGYYKISDITNVSTYLIAIAACMYQLTYLLKEVRATRPQFNLAMKILKTYDEEEKNHTGTEVFPSEKNDGAAIIEFRDLSIYRDSQDTEEPTLTDKETSPFSEKPKSNHTGVQDATTSDEEPSLPSEGSEPEDLKIPDETFLDATITFSQNDSKQKLAGAGKSEIANERTHLLSEEPEHLYFLKNISFSIKPNTITAFVGSSGCGKSTLLKLLVGWLPYDLGKVLIWGTEIREIKLPSLRKKVAYAVQHPTLYSDITPWGSLSENIKLGSFDEKDDENCERVEDRLQSAVTLAGLDGKDLKGSIEKYSGGEKQRVNLARAFFKRDIAKIFIFDESTSALDNKSQSEVMKEIKKLKKSDTAVLIIAHRLETIVDADQIIYISVGTNNDGSTYGHIQDEKSDIGDHSHLMERCEGYRKLHMKSDIKTDLLYLHDIISVWSNSTLFFEILVKAVKHTNPKIYKNTIPDEVRRQVTAYFHENIKDFFPSDKEQEFFLMNIEEITKYLVMMLSSIILNVSLVLIDEKYEKPIYFSEPSDIKPDSGISVTLQLKNSVFSFTNKTPNLTKNSIMNREQLHDLMKKKISFRKNIPEFYSQDDISVLLKYFISSESAEIFTELLNGCNESNVLENKLSFWYKNQKGKEKEESIDTLVHENSPNRIFVPINLNTEEIQCAPIYWTLLIIISSREIVYIDPLNKAMPELILSILFNAFKTSPEQIIKMKIKSSENINDCGPIVVESARRYLDEELPEDLDINAIKKEHQDILLKKSVDFLS